MDITQTQRGDALQLKVAGRLDAYWSDHLQKAIDESIQAGFHRIELHLAGVEYVSSAGIRILIKTYKRLQSIQGALTVTEPSESALAILELAGLAALLHVSAASAATEREPERRETPHAVYGLYTDAEATPLACEFSGDPGKLEALRFAANDCVAREFPDTAFGLGLGAFGNGFEDCRGRFGEFLAVAGAAAYLPTDGTQAVDYLISEGALVPNVKTLYGVRATGRFAHQIRFEAKPESPGVVPLSEVLETAFQIAGTESIGVTMVAEAAGLVGAALTRSVATGEAGESPMAYPGIRDWIAFTPERIYDRTAVILVGVASRTRDAPWAQFLRPMREGGEILGHFHAVVFPYRPVQRGELDLTATVNALFSSETVQGLLHLLRDDRPIEGVGESELMRGVCWVGPIGSVSQLPLAEPCDP